MKRKASNTTKKRKYSKTKYTRPNWQDNFFQEFDAYCIEREDWRQGLLRDIKEFYQEDESRLIIEEWCYARNIPRRTLYMWRDKYQDVKDGLKDLLIMLGMRRQLGMMRGELDRISASKSLWRYDEECDRDEKRAVELAEKTQQKIMRDNLMVHEDVKRELRKKNETSENTPENDD